MQQSPCVDPVWNVSPQRQCTGHGSPDMGRGRGNVPLPITSPMRCPHPREGRSIKALTTPTNSPLSCLVPGVLYEPLSTSHMTP